jgi:glycylpeptide N-tetradecanoyltransferase
MEKDPAPPMDASQTPAGEHRVTPGEKKPETQMTESKNDTEEIADPSKATDIFQNYMQSFSNKQIMQTYGQKHLEELVKKREFWDSQPVPKTKELMTGELAQVHGPLEKKTIDDVRKEPYPLPEEFEWGIVELNNLPELDELYDHLYNHYVEDDDGFFRFNYSREFIKWALSPPGYEKDMLISIKDKKTGKMVAFISGVIINLKVATFLKLD